MTNILKLMLEKQLSNIFPNDTKWEKKHYLYSKKEQTITSDRNRGTYREIDGFSEYFKNIISM